jgi:hypothetical protein
MSTRPQIIVDADEKEKGPRFLGLPERWYEAPGPTWRCENGHVSHCYLKSEEKGYVCLAGDCEKPVWLTFPEDKEEPPTP